MSGSESPVSGFSTLRIVSNLINSIFGREQVSLLLASSVSAHFGLFFTVDSD